MSWPGETPSQRLWAAVNGCERATRGGLSMVGRIMLHLRNLPCSLCCAWRLVGALRARAFSPHCIAAVAHVRGAGLLVSAGYEGKVLVLDADSKAELFAITLPETHFCDSAVAHDTVVAAGYRQPLLVVIDVVRHAVVLRELLPNRPFAVTISPDARHIVVALDKGLRLERSVSEFSAQTSSENSSLNSRVTNRLVHRQK